MSGGNELLESDLNKFIVAFDYGEKIKSFVSFLKSSDSQTIDLQTKLTEKCNTILKLLDQNHEINEFEWVKFIKKAILLS